MVDRAMALAEAFRSFDGAVEIVPALFDRFGHGAALREECGDGGGEWLSGIDQPSNGKLLLRGITYLMPDFKGLLSAAGKFCQFGRVYFQIQPLGALQP